MRAGRARFLVTIQKKASGFDSHGQALTTWNDFKSVLLDVVPLSGRELELARQKVASATYRLSGVWFAGVSPKDRVLHGGRELYVASVENVGERNREIVLLCGETIE